MFWGYGGGVAGHFAAGWLIDRIGRKRTCAGFYVGAALSIALLYQVPSLTGQYVWMIATVFCFAAANTSTHVYASELFPTEIRATGYGWTTNLVGRMTEVADADRDRRALGASSASRTRSRWWRSARSSAPPWCSATRPRRAA